MRNASNHQAWVNRLAAFAETLREKPGVTLIHNTINPPVTKESVDRAMSFDPYITDAPQDLVDFYSEESGGCDVILLVTTPMEARTALGLRSSFFCGFSLLDTNESVLLKREMLEYFDEMTQHSPHGSYGRGRRAIIENSVLLARQESGETWLYLTEDCMIRKGIYDLLYEYVPSPELAFPLAPTLSHLLDFSERNFYLLPRPEVNLPWMSEGGVKDNQELTYWLQKTLLLKE